MGADCCDHCDLPDPHRGNPAYRRVLWAVLAINAVMFAVEIGAGLAAGSAALQADAPRGSRGEKRRRDCNQAAKLVIRIATGQVEDRPPILHRPSHEGCGSN